MVGMKLYVEGGGDTNLLRTACRKGFSDFLKKAGLAGSMPRIVACGSRRDALDAFTTAIHRGEEAMLLVDSEGPVSSQHQKGHPENWEPWAHLHSNKKDQWQKPVKAKNTDCHLMVQCMESWFLTDRVFLQKFYGQGFNPKALPSEEKPIESISPETILQALSDATKKCKTKSKYGKGEHSFKILALIDPNTIAKASPWASRFLDILRKTKP
ncbi:uncharacterized protein DUF4276 [Desulfobotulus alkaliphilus]|uniref:Uncharacterized protein DUF4276 n=2 Tax=Desulfobotulus alkaliphilus TaxID=622671 RepID=A0A562RHM1_9BACT|nr:uncharacterized protein DUF4276 [Desulfobotulus alkaliphilus]